jgi:hypothetical protein
MPRHLATRQALIYVPLLVLYYTALGAGLYAMWERWMR